MRAKSNRENKNKKNTTAEIIALSAEKSGEVVFSGLSGSFVLLACDPIISVRVSCLPFFLSLPGI